ncbi:MAG: DUF4097 family beta strand repeat-containing protein [Oscillospiraceae bacterium]|nr:DUF4097 family beta strand repeat-containing protein [Oscillospiraceae bacterium]MDD4369270.1 DUF4097 family beta strand repeat-containing protein [Oscillospiraceae bacterium]
MMSKETYLKRLKTALQQQGQVKGAELGEVLAFFEELWEDRLENGQSEAAIWADLGEPEAAAGQITAEVASQTPQPGPDPEPSGTKWAEAASDQQESGQTFSSGQEQPQSYDKTFAATCCRQVVLETFNQQIEVGPSEDGRIHLTFTVNKWTTYKLLLRDEFLFLRRLKKEPSGGLAWLWPLRFQESLAPLMLRLPTTVVYSLLTKTRNGGSRVEGVRLHKLDLRDQNAALRLTGLEPETLDARSSNGGISLEQSQIRQGLSLQSSNAGISCAQVDAGWLEMTSSNGRLTCSQVQLKQQAALITSNAAIQLTDLRADKLDCQSSNGGIKVEGLAVKHIRLVTSNANIRGTIRGKAADYYQGMPETAAAESAPYLYTQTSNGRVSLDFAGE